MTGVILRRMGGGAEWAGARRIDDGVGPTRLLETMREWANDRLNGRGERGATEARLLQWAVALARDAEPHLVQGKAEWLESLDANLANLRAALAVAAERPDLAVGGLEVAARLGRYWFLRTLHREGRDWLRRLLDAPGAPASLRAHGLYTYGFLSGEIGDDTDDAVDALDRSVEVYREIHDDAGLSWALNNRARVGFTYRVRARADLDESLQLARSNGDRGCLFVNLMFAICWDLTYGKPADAQNALNEALAIARAVGAPHGLAHCLEFEAHVDLALGKTEHAVSSMREALAYASQVANAGCCCHALETTAWLLASTGDSSEARLVRDSSRTLRAEFHAPPAPFEAFGGYKLERFAPCARFGFADPELRPEPFRPCRHRRTSGRTPRTRELPQILGGR